ncbi:hypothetical protein A2641_01185 [Candidatus Nomurabacteria bacterium RIFCSPHIGHO2_01_FULL_37_25]|uniref:Zinc-binding domain-containing protein n=1 Tax=Candidatus Nomurabacteria bacterium RIFCSPLOWO2_01_FULL_36_16 TaxID=1801767 RepID=A0A1F6WYV7_9BACT|nr:MAG: hypothetical protein A2641_01185 [Candidatus Nomurabacteria bacterium RIFCSPHIGHO2_01_FULL_37_25]OGI75332.1 MAG: hypothetical protein A3D36_02085 [Candidatus Nomurabacteria bacterium RIFCSPHIGHO2_02_FULL_36_29]OGI87079.1 MAG: hypothetical protein A3A91_00180 [Candidatus Nomurabacteria bacterium RIFCSPLOWO2_01_FULL_36_16]OGI95238.1 MAG: hypothetical protein A3I84_02655 [Candidatus Nomurabacteria bacterium RIFCSPLOWO2_02_FULL_36_8]
MKPETKNCQNCKKDFTIEPEDFNFYEKIKVPPPSWCPECRMIRRFAAVNTLCLFYRNCDKCNKRTLSMISPEEKIKVFCQPCWWADDWDGSEYEMEYDPTRTFLSQLKELSLKTPYPALESSYLTLKNCDYCNALAYSKDCSLIFWADYCESVFYSSILNGLKWSADCLRGWKSELCYESTGFIRSYRTFFSEDFDDCVDVWFSRNCYGCINCVGCVNLRGAKYQIFNVQYSKEEYAKKLKEFGFDSWKKLKEFDKKAREFWLTKPYREFHGNAFNLNVTGEHIYVSKNSKECFILNGAENCKWCQLVTVDGSKDCMDYSGWGHNAELIYESASVGEGVSNVKFSALCFPDVANSEYCIFSIAGKYNFGCANLKRKKYSILNKQYSKEDYEILREKIIMDMKKNPYVDNLGRVWSYGEFPQIIFGIFPYNKSNAMRFFPKTKEQALSEGYRWDDAENPIYPITIKSTNLPDTIQETNDLILNEVIECMTCARSFRIIKGELEVLRKMGLPVPHECPKCRENRRFERMNGPGMYHRQCAKCNLSIYTPYDSKRPEIVYCVKCYQQEFI